MKAKGSFLSWIVVSNLKEARKFFVEVLGLKEHSFYEGEYKWAEYQGDEGQMIGVAEKDEQLPAGNNAVITFTVDDIEKAIEDISPKVNLIGDIMEVPGHVKMQTFSDKDGNYFQLCQLLGEK
jgi:predicted enzyme related to lactoylglutathione lyase